jgi:IclR family KDG regulon transcriptional repressor
MSVSRSTAKSHGAVKTVDRLVRILDCFSPEHPSWSLSDLSAQLGLPKSTLHRFLVSLESHGILHRDPGDKRWCLGYRLSVWGSVAVESTSLRHIARPIMRDLVAATGETALLTAYHDREVICIEKVETGRPVRMTLDVGRRQFPHAGASCKVLMAHLPEEEIQAIVRDKGLPRLCTNTITDPAELMAELARIREHGYAESQEETDLSAWGVAAPICDRTGEVVAAIGVAGPTSRFTGELHQRAVMLCRQASRRISALLSTGMSRRVGTHPRAGSGAPHLGIPRSSPDRGG